MHPSSADDIHIPTETRLFPTAAAAKEDTPSIKKKVIDLGNQSCQLSFSVEEDCTIHGLAGYFHCTLYKDIVFSTVPEQIMSLSPGMFSWFPMYFPATHPIRVQAQDRIEVYMWRCVDGDRMWYEWSVASSGGAAASTALISRNVTPVQNALGRAFHIQL